MTSQLCALNPRNRCGKTSEKETGEESITLEAKTPEEETGEKTPVTNNSLLTKGMNICTNIVFGLSSHLHQDTPHPKEDITKLI